MTPQEAHAYYKSLLPTASELGAEVPPVSLTQALALTLAFGNTASVYSDGHGPRIQVVGFAGVESLKMTVDVWPEEPGVIADLAYLCLAFTLNERRAWVEAAAQITDAPTYNTVLAVLQEEKIHGLRAKAKVVHFS